MVNYYGLASNVAHATIVLFLASALGCLGSFLVSRSFSKSKRAVRDIQAIQSAHTTFTPRVGGLVIYLTLLLTFLISKIFFIDLRALHLLILSAIPIFAVGFAEDLGFYMSPYQRLLASIISTILVLVTHGVWIDNVSLPIFDYFLELAIVGILFTVFATVGVSNAFNLIDGLNGLSGYTVISTAAALAVLANRVDHSDAEVLLLFLIASVSGFLIFNFPFAKLFLGDAGAYTLGHLLVWLAIILVDYDDRISPFAILLIFFWPVADTILAIWRRWKTGLPTHLPDRLHFHQLVMRFIEIRYFGRNRRRLTNPIATLILIPFISVPQVLGVVFWQHIYSPIFLTPVVALLFFFSYLSCFKLATKGRSRGLVKYSACASSTDE